MCGGVGAAHPKRFSDSIFITMPFSRELSLTDFPDANGIFERPGEFCTIGKIEEEADNEISMKIRVSSR